MLFLFGFSKIFAKLLVLAIFLVLATTAFFFGRYYQSQLDLSQLNSYIAGENAKNEAGVVAATPDDNGKSISVPKGKILRVVLDSSAWSFVVNNNKITPVPGSPQTKTNPNCFPWMNCGTTIASFEARDLGNSVIQATRQSCGDFLPCESGQDKYILNIIVTE